MSWERELIRGEAGMGPLWTLLAPVEFLDAGAFLTQAGDIGLAISLDPVPFETLDQDEMDRVTQRVEAAFRTLDGNVRVYQYLLKRQIFPMPQADARMQYLLGEKGPLYEVTTVIVLCDEATRSGSHQVMPYGREAAIDREMRSAARLLLASADGFLNTLNGVVKARIMQDGETFRFLRMLMNYGAADARQLVSTLDLNWQIADQSVNCEGDLRVGDHFVRVLTLKDPPRQTYAHQLRALYEIPCDLTVVTEWKALAPAQTDSEIRKMRRHLNHLTTSATNYLGKNQPRDHEILVDQGKLSQIQQLGEALREIQTENTYFGEFSLTVLLHHEDPAIARAAVGKAANAFHVHGAAIVEHLGKAALAVWLACVPGNRRYNVRLMRLSNLNYADLGFFFGPHRGEQRNAHLNGECISFLPTNQQTLYGLNLHRGQVGHALITGRTGSGKSYLLNFLAANIQKYAPYTVIFDIARTFEKLTAAFNGSYMEIGRYRDSPTINPFSLEPTEENFAFLYSFIRLLLESDGAARLTDEETTDVARQVRSIYQLPREVRSLRRLGLMPRLERRLTRWTAGGQYGFLFDNTLDTLSFNRFQTFAFPKMREGEEALEALLFYVLHRSLDLIWASSRPAFVIFDEGWTFLRHPATRVYILSALKSFRKQNASLVLTLHSLADLDPDLLQAVVESCLTRIHGPNPGIDGDAWAKAFRMSARQTELIRQLVPGRQWLVQDSGVVSLTADPESHKLYATAMEVQ